MNSSETTASRIGTISHCSLLRKKIVGLGLRDGTSLVVLAVRRGCRHYLPYVESIQAEAPAVSTAELSNEELVAALLLGCHRYEPILIRAAAQMVGSPSIQPARMALLAVRERCDSILRYIAECALRIEPENAFWPELLQRLPNTFRPRAGSLPHPSRFWSETGMVNPKKPGTPRIQWLRPAVRKQIC